MLDLIDVELGKASPMITEHYESKTVQAALRVQGIGPLTGSFGQEKGNVDD